MNTTGGIKYDAAKARVSILPLEGIHFVMAVGEFGAGKYSDNNYKKGMPVTKFINAAFRHIFIEWLIKGNDLDIDPDCVQCQQKNCTNNPDPKLRLHSGLPHLAHGAWNILAALEQMQAMPELDDRFKRGSK